MASSTETTPKELYRLIRLAIAFGVLGLIAVASSLLFFATSASNARDEICEVVIETSRGNTEALIATVIEASDNPHRITQIADQYRDRVERALEPCK